MPITADRVLAFIVNFWCQLSKISRFQVSGVRCQISEDRGQTAEDRYKTAI